MTEQDPQQHLAAALAGLWRAGCAFVATIQDFEPDLVLALYHAVQGPLVTARAIWDTQCAGEPFPPVVGTNLGREKTRRFEDVREELGFPYPYIEWMSESWETGHFMAWAAQQETWLVELAAQTQTVWRNAEPPKRILGILAYGSLLEDPGAELEPFIVARIPVTTPFAVEYARSSRRRAGAPTLVPVEASMGAPVAAQILVLRPDLPEEELEDRLYRREINRVGDFDYTYNDAEQREKKDAVLIETAPGLGGVPTVYYTGLKANIPEVLRADLSAEAKAEHLAELALGSVTPETYAEGRDGIQYLAQAIAHGIETPLTAAYRAAILRRAGDAPDLEAAREWISQEKGP